MSIKRILIIDDSASVRRKAAAALTAVGFDVVEADNGIAGAQRIEEDPTLSLVVCDVHMPCLDGIGLLTSLQHHPSRPPFLMLTSEVDLELIRQAKRAGARGWLVKPFTSEQLAETVTKLVAGARSRS